MIVCHCTQISDHEIRAAIDWMRHADPQTIITPGKIYHALGKRADCGGCMPLFLDTMRQSDRLEVAPPMLRAVTDSMKGYPDEGRRQGHRLSQRRAAI
ncbi:(2Fe-2S)-binding protein [Paracoccus spongiarum]|uniref:(2Fe-2S)-binding protein n=1 Tax=Paracoccus spongiarum TaxID=3064387 RepID=A0ABT9JDE7_9RHOB|nr:(2Fe-2S)-binding protein [Paracoccus sp. 2205BS29-5]MDP5307096.1 (2Fe-2S)-binding protein [Paracoccus sp. 2205BS29-5]